MDTNNTYAFGAADASFTELRAHGVIGDVLVMTSLADPVACRTRAPQHASPLFMTFGGKTYLHDPRLKLLGNTVKDPGQQTLGAGNVLSAMGVATTCPNVQKTFANRAGCVRRPTCAPLRFSAVDVALTHNLRKVGAAMRSRVPKRSARFVSGLPPRSLHRVTGFTALRSFIAHKCTRTPTPPFA